MSSPPIAVGIRGDRAPNAFWLALGAESVKLRTVRSTMWALLATLVATVGIGALIAMARVNRWDRLSLREQLHFDAAAASLRGIFLAQLVLGVLGVLVISSEFATGMIRTTFTAMPRRATVLAAKAFVFAVVAFAVALVGCVLAFAIGQSIFAQKHVGLSISAPGALRAIVGGALYLTVVGLLGLALGTLLRRTAGAIATLFGLLLIVPLLVGALPDPWATDINKYLPGDAGRALFTVAPQSSLLSPAGGLIVLACWALGSLIVAGMVLCRRDA
jgi:ABC-type transport system involved in multi-copper enzyme maturation permease subunit